MEDSLEKIEREMLEAKVALVQSPLGPVALVDWANRLRALRERDDCHHGKSCRCFAHINEALNSGDGTYRP